MGALVGTHILTNETAPEMFEGIVDPSQCCRLCTGSSTQQLYSDISRTTEASCPIFILSYATAVGWICQFHSSNATTRSDYDTQSIAYFPM